MKNRSFGHRPPYYFKRSIHARKPGITLKLMKLPFDGKQELEPILRWEDDGGQMTDVVLIQSRERRVDQPEKNIILAHESIFDSFHMKLLRIQPM